MKTGHKTDVGLVRKNNEDRLIVNKETGLFIVADGMGGHQGGEVAGEMAVESISSSLKEFLKGGSSNISSIIYKAIHKANEEIYRKAKQDIKLNGMGTTIVLALCRNDKIHIAHVGDSRAYLIRDGRIRQLTQDHSLVAELLEAGGISKEDVRNHHLRHIVTNALGIKESVEPDIMSMSPRDGDYFLLCTDGLTDMMTDAEIREVIINSDNVQRTCEDLISSANEKSGKDNVTVILISIS